MNPDFKAGMRAFDQGEPYDPAQRGQWRRGWETARDNAERYRKSFDHLPTIEERYGNRDHYLSRRGVSPARLVDLNAWIAQEREARQLMARLEAFAISIGCYLHQDEIVATPAQAEALELWWAENAPPAKPK